MCVLDRCDVMAVVVVVVVIYDTVTFFSAISLC